MLTLKPFITIGPHQKESRLRIFLSQVEYTRMSSDPSQRDVTKKKRFAIAQTFFLFSLCSVNLIANPNFGRTIIHDAYMKRGSVTNQLLWLILCTSSIWALKIWSKVLFFTKQKFEGPLCQITNSNEHNNEIRLKGAAYFTMHSMELTSWVPKTNPTKSWILGCLSCCAQTQIRAHWNAYGGGTSGVCPRNICIQI